jgi:hypothetical protein
MFSTVQIGLPPPKKLWGWPPTFDFFGGRFSVHGHLDSTIEAATNINNIDHSWLCHPGTFQISLFGTKFKNYDIHS